MSQHHRKSSNHNFQSLQYDNKSNNNNTIRYQHNGASTKPGRYGGGGQTHSNSAPTTPRGSSGRPQFDHRLSAQGSPLPRRQGSNQHNQAPNNHQHHYNQNNSQHRRGQTHPSLEQCSSRELQHANDYRNNNYAGVENLSKYDYQLNEQNLSRGRNLSDPRKGHIGIPHHQQRNDSQEHFHTPHQQQNYDQTASSSKYLQESRSFPVKSGYTQQYDPRTSNSELRNVPSKGAEATFRPIDNNFQQQQPQQKPQQQQQQQTYLQGASSDIDYRASTGDVRRPPISVPSPQQNQKQGLQVTNSNNPYNVTNDPYKLTHINSHQQPWETSRREALSPRQQHHSHGMFIQSNLLFLLLYNALITFHFITSLSRTVDQSEQFA